MEPQPENPRRRGAIALVGLAALGLLAGLAILLDLGPFADEQLSEAELRARGDAICRQAHRDFEKLQADPPRTASEAAALTAELVEISSDELDAVRELDAPDSLEAALDRYLEAREAGIDSLRAGLEAAEDGDAQVYAKAQADVAAGQLERAGLARRVGFSECSRVLFGRDQLAQDAEPPQPIDPGAPPTVSNPPTGTP